MLTVQLALDTGLPVYVGCSKCDVSSRPLDLQALLAAGRGDLDLEAHAKSGRFKCGSCGNAGRIMPTMDFLLRDRQRWHERCLGCGKERFLTAAQAVETYGLATPVDVVRTAALDRCRSANCQMLSGACSRWPPLNVPRVPKDRTRREPEWPRG